MTLSYPDDARARGSAVGKIVGNNVLRHKDRFEPEVRQWVFQETYKNERLTDIINRTHENPKYLPGIALPSNLVAVPDLAEATRDATVLVFVLPHQFVKQVCDDLSHVSLSQTVKAISLIKGLEINSNGVTLFSEEIARHLGLQHVAALSGANIANEVAEEKFCESTVGCHVDDEPMYFQLFDTPYFRVQVIRDHAGVQLCGALKNIVAVGAGLSDGLG